MRHKRREEHVLMVVMFIEMAVFILLFVCFNTAVNLGQSFNESAANLWADFLVALSGGTKY